MIGPGKMKMVDRTCELIPNHKGSKKKTRIEKDDCLDCECENAKTILASTEFIHENKSVTQGPDLPEARSDHCQMSYQYITIITGEYHSKYLTFLKTAIFGII